MFKYNKNIDYFDKIICFLAGMYVYVSFGLSGLPGISRFSFISAVGMTFLLSMRKQKLHVAPWIVLFVTLYLYLILPALILAPKAIDTLSGITTVLLGTACIGIVLTNRLLELKHTAYLMLAAGLTNVIAIMLGIDTTPVEYRGYGISRLTGLLGNANVLAINLSFASMAILLLKNRIPIYIALFSIVSAFYGIYVSGSRKGIILGVALLVMATMYLSKKISRIFQVFIVVSTTIVVLLFYQYLENAIDLLSSNVIALNRFAQIFSGGDTSYSERKWLIDVGYKIWLDSPFVGEGFGQFATLSGFGAYSHNNFIELLVSGGLIAIALYYAFYFLVFYYSFKFRKKEFVDAVIVVTTLIVADLAMVSFVGRSSMLFLIFVICYFYGEFKYCKTKSIFPEKNNGCFRNETSFCDR